MTETLRIAMWSGPRNISTAMLRSFGNRPDTAVTDEPLYGHYLRATGLDHPGRDEVIAAQPDDWRVTADRLCGPAPGNKPIWYQKHMAHHLLPEMDRCWVARLTNCFLIRDPREVLASYTRVRGTVTLADTGLPQQAELFEQIAARGGNPPPVLDSNEVLRNPRRLLALFCDAVGIPFTETMLSWPAGPRPTDGVWASYWYDSVYGSTGFAPYREKHVVLADALEVLATECAPYYRMLFEHRLGR